MKAETERYLRDELVAQLPEAVILFDFQGSVVYANPSAQVRYKELKAPLHELLFTDLYVPAKQESWSQIWDTAKSSASFFLKAVSLDKKEELSLWVNYMGAGAAPCVAVFEIHDAKLSGMADSKEDIERKLKQLNDLNYRLSKEVNIRKQIEENLQAYAEELKSKNEELEQFAYVASHDLQEPLRMVSSFTQLLANRYSGKMDKDADEFINYITEGARRMQDLISDLLVYSRVGRKGEAFCEVDLNEIVKAVEQNLSLQIDESDAVIHTEKLPVVFGDQRQLLQLMQNLISNAIKFRQETQSPDIHIFANDMRDYWEISIRDNGIGIDPRHQERIFQIFQRLHTRDKYPGTGIGLAICKKIVERHGGEIWLESAEGEGSTFHFTLKKQELPNEL